MSQDTAAQEGAEFLLDEARDRLIAVCSARKEALELLAHYLVEEALLRIMALVLGHALSSLGLMLVSRLACLILVVTASLAAAPVHAVSCRQWERMGPEQKSATLERMIQGAVSGSGGRQYQVERGAVGRCLERNAQSIQYEFDDACSDPRSASMQALNRIFKHHIWSCAG